jgi:PAS domain S-box-containing protein
MNASRSSWATQVLDGPDKRIGGRAQRVLLAGTEQVAQAGSWQWCPETGELRWSDNLFRIYGVEPGEVVPSTQMVLRLCHQEDRARVRLHLDDLARECTALPVEYRVVLPKGGGVRYLRSTVATAHRNAARSLVIVGTVQDVTAAWHAEREIASRVAVTSALAAWQSFEQGMEGLLRELAGALGARAGTAWLPDRDLLVAKAFWSDDAESTLEFEVATRNLRLPRGVGLPGRVWESKHPAA